MKRLSKRSDPARRRRSFVAHTLLLCEPLYLSALASGLWCLANAAGLHFSKADEAPLIGAVVTTLAVAYGITVTLVFGTVWEKYQKVVVCVLKKDRDTFLCYRDERVPITVHLLIAALSLPLLAMIGGLEYSSWRAGLAAVSSTAFVLSLYWIVIAELQNPAKSPWFAERIPQAWLEIDVDKHFGLGEGS